MCETKLKSRTKQFAWRIIKPSGSLPTPLASRTIANQLLRSAYSVGANYQATEPTNIMTASRISATIRQSTIKN